MSERSEGKLSSGGPPPATVASAPADALGFRLIKEDAGARLGELRLPRGVVRTPAFMPVGTAATVKAMFPGDVRAIGADIILANTYHLMLRPGAERVAALGGLHVFANWRHPILTDSGGFQVMSLAGLREVGEAGVTFRSHLDGALYELTPERSIEIQTLLDADIAMQLDECVALPADAARLSEAMLLSLRWAERCKRAFDGSGGRALFGIVQGGDLPELRLQSAKGLTEIGFDGYAIGGLAVGEPQAVMLDILKVTTPALPGDRPRYLMGVGTPGDIIEAVARGVDMFDCVMPTRAGRHGLAYTRFGKINLRNARHTDDPEPLDAESPWPPARDYSRAYLHHLVKNGEMLSAMLLTWSNLAYYLSLMADIRAAIADDRFEDFAATVKEGWARCDPARPA